MWVCEFPGFPAVKWGASHDMTSSVTGVTCSRLDQPLPGSNFRAGSFWYKVAQLIEAV
jgi:hypothetical protein